MTYTFNTASEALPSLLRGLLDRGEEVGSRNGRVKEFLNTQIVLEKPANREIVAVDRHANVFAQIAETMWVLSGRNDIEWLSAYLPRAVDYSDDGEHWRAGYGPRIRSWATDLGQHGDGNVQEMDQLAYVVNTLRKDPLSRQAVIGIWDPAVDTTPGKDRACNTQLQFQSRLGKLHLTVTVRSNDVMWGWSGINAFEWSTLQEIVASLLGIHVGTLTFNIGSLHLYQQHWVKAERIANAPHINVLQLPTVPFNRDGQISTLDEVDRLASRWFIWEGLCRKGEATADLLKDWEEPLTRSWAQAIAYYWTRDAHWLADIRGTALHAAIATAPASVLPEPVQKPASSAPGVGTGAPPSENPRAFYDFVTNLHAEKHASYGDSWKKRGEKMSILANIARKVDRLGVGDQYDSSADTLIDFWVYLAKYLCWIEDVAAGPENVNPLLKQTLDEAEGVEPEENWETAIPADFDAYVERMDDWNRFAKRVFVSNMLRRAAPIARDLWLAENAGDEYRGADHD